MRIGPITTINKWFLIHTIERERRGHLGLDQVIPYITANMHQREEYASMMNPFYEYEIWVQEPVLQNRGTITVQKMRVPRPG